MRTVTFSDDRVVERLQRKFVCSWMNIRPSTRFGDVRREIGKLRPEDGSDNICAFLARPDGRILHAIQGFYDAEAFLAELDFGLAAAKLPDRELPEFYRKRTTDKELLSLNLWSLAERPLPELGSILRNDHAGLK